MAGLFALVGLCLGIVSLVALVRPLPAVKMPTRKHAAAGLAVSMLLLAVGGSLSAPPPAKHAAEQVHEEHPTPVVEPAESKPQIREVIDVILAMCYILTTQGSLMNCESDINLLEENWMVLYGRMNGVEADALCDATARAVASQVSMRDITVRAAWQVRIHTPHTGDHPLAVCPIRFAQAGKQ